MPHRVAHIDELPPVPDHGLEIDAEWRPVRHHLGVEAFGTNAYVAAEPGAVVVEDHDEGDYGHQELYLVLRGRAEFTLDGEQVDAPAGTFVFLHVPSTRRKAVALEADTAVVAFGAKPGEAFRTSEWEERRLGSLGPAAR